MRRRQRDRRLHAAVRTGAVCGVLILGAATERAGAATLTFGYTGAEQQVVVPADVYGVQVVAIGGRGGAGGAPGGFGAVASALLPVTPGQVLFVEVGGNGGPGGNTPAAGGFNGGAPGGIRDSGGGAGPDPTGAGGGGATDVRTAARGVPGSLGTRLVVAAGGGGAGGLGEGGAGAGGAGGAPGGNGTSETSCIPAGGGGPGQTTAGGSAGAAGYFASPGFAGSFGVGGAGGGSVNQAGGGGGGGGLYGGGGGGGGGSISGEEDCGAGGGGGGSSGFTPRATGTSVAAGGAPQGSVTLTYAPTPRDRLAPRLTTFVMTPSRFIAANTGPGIRAAARVGSRVFYRLSEASTVRFTVERPARGIKRGKRCVRRPQRVRSGAKRCTRYIPLRGSLPHRGTAGLNSVRFMGRLRGRALKRGRYRLVARATDAAGNRSESMRKRFRIVRR